MSSTGYSKLQVRLHWIIAALVILQFALHDGMVATSNALSNGETPAGKLLLLAETHVVFGLAIFILALVRLWVRIKRGTPPPPPDEHALLKVLSHTTHWLLYALILLMPVSGSLAWFGQVEIAATLHGLAKPLLLIVVALHLGGALYQHFIARSDVLRRMLRSEEL